MVYARTDSSINSVERETILGISVARNMIVNLQIIGNFVLDTRLSPTYMTVKTMLTEFQETSHGLAT